MLKRRTIVYFSMASFVVATATAETTLQVAITCSESSVITVAPGAVLEYEIVGQLSGDATEGLSMFALDLAFDGGDLEPLLPPTTGALLHFDRPAGLTNPGGFGGTPVGGALRQVGGAQNTLLLEGPPPLPAGAVITGVATTSTVLARGMLAAPSDSGSYVLSASNVRARAIAAGADGSGGSWSTIDVTAGSLTPLTLVVDACLATCGDADGNGRRDDSCTWASCAEGECTLAPTAHGDIGGPFGACTFDGFANVHDRTHVLRCFEGSSTCQAVNLDVGGEFGACGPDGFCNVHDVNHVLMAFATIGTCACGAAPTGPGAPLVAGTADLILVQRAGESTRIVVDVFVDGRLRSLQSYELHLRPSAELDLREVSIDPGRADFVFAGEPFFFAANRGDGKMLAGVEHAGRAVVERAYLATFEYARAAVDRLQLPRSTPAADRFGVRSASPDRTAGRGGADHPAPSTIRVGTGTVLVANYRHVVALTTTPPLAVRIGGLRP